MGLSSDEMVTLSADVLDLWKTIQEIKGDDSPGGKKITRREGRSLLKKIIALAAQLSLDILD
ncbi:MAG: hypothetical protein Unbinned2514contig1000_13 [Prokaryotic dsDNA virus sp.]|nr:MAG: hypothetical protein Unbinned2514contig1000_13 [Prokaryotic dsDNA virus sp.]|tara:strand:- start:6843 stop:7028 length:186 start_codon:yes stop_codon:yes gene_type:complete